MFRIFIALLRVSFDPSSYNIYFLGVKGGRWVGLIFLLPSCVIFLKFWVCQPPGLLKTSPGLYRNCLTFTLLRKAYSTLIPCYWYECNVKAIALENTQLWLMSYILFYLQFWIWIIIIISNLSNDRSKASSKTIPPHSAIYRFLLQLTLSSPVLKVIQ